MENTMPSANSLYSQICTDKVIYDAWRAVRSNKGKPGPDGITTDVFQSDLLTNLKEVQSDLVGRRYRHGPVKLVQIPKEGGGTRGIAILCVRDRIVHRAVHEVVGSHVDARLHPHSFAYRPGRSAETAVKRLTELAGPSRHWVAHVDIEACFDSLRRSFLRKQVRRFVGDRGILRIVDMSLEASSSARPVSCGIWQGSPLSPLLANVYLDAFDRRAEAAGLRFVRYIDNVVFVAPSQPEVKRDLQTVTRLLRKIGLSVNPQKTLITHFERGVALFGYFLRLQGRKKPRVICLPRRPKVLPVRATVLRDQHESPALPIIAGMGRESA